ncbi:trypsin-like peptidase domain-containing protein [Psychroflexus sp. CAK57W]|uniref:trypsin-like peptidase domain-containing protein n=1 Tax=Psychroflexus curvus TaxID=2873595 RepID=UPI001CCC9695|nr:trypsin-like peptidase domain-containing protein [Psychroflexus curvus]MBZ9627710.1 trypsin-like peptidase domain-containing protein [Psychroflexus curvus]MBZ9786197.1 trypsin-like peptidase domain-containing protein [Psychroflexus curvus]
MKKSVHLLSIALFASVLSIGGYKFFFEESHPVTQDYKIPWQKENKDASTQLATYTGENSEMNFTEAAKKTVNAVVHVKNITTTRQARSAFEYYYGSGEIRKAIRGAGSGVILSPDGLIVTNNHVIEGASEVQVTLNNNETYVAEILGTAPDNDIALLKIDATDLDYLPFGDSNDVEIGEWVLAVGNPFNLTSTVTAGIVSAKARDLGSSDNKFQSFLQTDAAVNPGNSGGALVNTRGELIGINTAITSQTGSFVGYSFAIPSNNAKKIVEDLLEFGNVRKAILGVTGSDLNSIIAKELNVDSSQGFYISNVEPESGASKAGLQKGDIITFLDDIKIRKFADMTGYLNSKNPGETVKVVYLRNNDERQADVTLDILKVYQIKEIGVEVSELTKAELKKYGAASGVIINKMLPNSFTKTDISGLVITKINEKEVNSIDDVKSIIGNKDSEEPMLITFLSPNGQEKTYVFR